MKSEGWPIQRRYVRTESAAALNVVVSGGSVRGRCRDISKGGAGAYLAVPVEIGQTVLVEIMTPDAPERYTARVVHREGLRHGFEFIEGAQPSN